MGVGGYDYSHKAGPHSWRTGKRQSPIDIVTSEVDQGSSLPPLTIQKTCNVSFDMVNSGTNITAVAKAESKLPCITCGPLQHEYEFLQMHMHWGDTDTCGSEHTVDGQAYAAELHLVHWNKDLFSAAGDAAAADDQLGLAVLGVFVQPDSCADHPAFHQLLAAYKHASYKTASPVPLTQTLNPYSLLPGGEAGSYYSYDGSLTTPPCSESVSWIVFKEPLRISQKQMEVLRSFKTCTEAEASGDAFTDPFEINADAGCCDHPPNIRNNFRPTQPLNGRSIKSCTA